MIGVACMENGLQWNRGDLKGRSKAVLRMHYWRVIFMTVLMSLFVGSGSIVSGVLQPIFNEIQFDSEIFPDWGREIRLHSIDQAAGAGILELEEPILSGRYYGVAFFAVVVAAVVVLAFIVFISVIAVEVFIVNPLYVGVMRFYVRSFDTKPQFKEFFIAFEKNYKNVTAIMFLRDLYTLLWTLLLFVPGVVKSYEYSMVPYLVAENPAINTKDAFAYSRMMMKGQKWKAFVLDLSFLGWKILSAMTFGVLGIFFVDPYSRLTNAALYRRLRGLDQIPHNIYYDGMEEDMVQGWYGQPEQKLQNGSGGSTEE